MIDNLRGILSDWLLERALDICPRSEKTPLAIAIRDYFVGRR